MLTNESVKVRSLGEPRFPSPLKLSTTPGDDVADFVPEGAGILYDIETGPGRPLAEPVVFERAGPRQKLFFDPAQVRAAIVTCGGLCPGLNNVIRSVCVQMWYLYGVKEVLGIRNGYLGLNPASGLEPLLLTPDFVDRIHKAGGTVLGSSRGPQDPAVSVDYLSQLGINILFCVGGDGTQRGALAISEEARKRGMALAVVGIPKTIDNDIPYVSRTFGYTTAIDKAREVLDCAHNEAKGAPNGISIVKLMGRDSGFIAAGATLASQEANFCLIPELPFRLDGNDGFLAALKRRIERRGHAVIVVAEGAGQDLLASEPRERDASGNVKHADIGLFLRDRVVAFFRSLDMQANVKYFDPSYIIRSVPANCEDALLCDHLARHAVHAAMAGKTEVMVGVWNSRFIHLPIPLIATGRKKINLESELWASVLVATGQPARFGV
ncbi:MAG: ATP-dependent 6-phosphofructokinase [Candidatus Sumerlaeaceae bacterium]|nr:ATP-dependent 6-phosphofructokinase [Candidatus Sumerlaeaceae bacterium]